MTLLVLRRRRIPSIPDIVMGTDRNPPREKPDLDTLLSRPSKTRQRKWAFLATSPPMGFCSEFYTSSVCAIISQVMICVDFGLYTRNPMILITASTYLLFHDLTRPLMVRQA
jgi:hypothetical protein